MASDGGQFGSFLRSRRERLLPEQLGLAAGRRRRTPGLRREEVAQLAGISAEWYVRLEQGRAGAPSPATVEALARALRLGEVERAHLRLLAHAGARRAFLRETVPDAVARLLAGLPHAAFVTGLRWDVLAWNAAASALLPDLETLAPDDRNLLLYMLTDARAQRLFGAAWAGEARRMLALFRPTHDLWAADPAFVDLVARIRRGCPGFDAWWTAHDVGTAASGRKLLHHPARGAIAVEYLSFQSGDDPALKLSVLLGSPR